MEITSLYNAFKSCAGVSTDTRTIESGALYFALSGDNFDGNNFVETAFIKGASHAVCTDPALAKFGSIILVSDVLIALQELATHHRTQLGIPVVGLTGSNGKTTTKELIISVLSQKYEVMGTKGNLNNHIGVPLTLLSFNASTEIGVVEMGANHIGEIEMLCDIARPDYGLITNFGKAHLEGFGSLEGVKTGKSELYKFLIENDGKAIVLGTDQEQLARTQNLKRRLTPELDLKSSQPITFNFDGQTATTQLTGSYNFNNMALAAGVGLEFGLSPNLIIRGLSDYKPENNRSQIIQKGKSTIIMDAYNANPTSMKAALESLAARSDKHKIAILGDMFELGSYAESEHQGIATLALELGIDQVILIGENFKKVTTATAHQFKDFNAFQDARAGLSLPEGTILIKGSRGMALERVLELL